MNTAIVIDEHPYLRAAVKHVLEKENIKLIEEARDGSSAIRLLREHRPDLVILDLDLPLLDGLSVLDRIRGDNLKTKFIVLTSLSPESYYRRCLDAGAAAFILKTEELQELINAIRSVMQGNLYYPRYSRRFGSKDRIATEMELINSLSNRELLVLKHLAVGKTNKQIGELLFISNKTVSTYKIRIYEKLNLNTVVDLSKFAIRNNLV